MCNGGNCAVCVCKPSHARRRFRARPNPKGARTPKSARVKASGASTGPRRRHRTDRPPRAPPRPRQTAGNAPRAPPTRPSRHHPNRGVTYIRSNESGVNGVGLSKLARIAKRSAKRLRRLAPRFAGLTRPSCPARAGKARTSAVGAAVLRACARQEGRRGGKRSRVARPNRARFAPRAQKLPRELARNRNPLRAIACVANRRERARSRNSANRNRACNVTDSRRLLVCARGGNSLAALLKRARRAARARKNSRELARIKRGFGGARRPERPSSAVTANV